MATYRSAQGKMVDMAALMAQNEKTQAVGVAGIGNKIQGMKVNARGDSIDNQGNVIKSMTEKRAQSYAKTVSNKSAQASTQTTAMKRPEPIVKDLTDDPSDFDTKGE
jgi:hypothetical protein